MVLLENHQRWSVLYLGNNMILSNSIPFSSDAKRRVKSHEFVGVGSDGCSVQPGWFHWVCRTKNGRLPAGRQCESLFPNSCYEGFFKSNECPTKIKIRSLRFIPSLFFHHCPPHPEIFGPRIVETSPLNFPRPKRTLRSSGSLFVKPLSWAVHVLSCWGKVTGRCAGLSEVWRLGWDMCV